MAFEVIPGGKAGQRSPRRWVMIKMPNGEYRFKAWFMGIILASCITFVVIRGGQ